MAVTISVADSADGGNAVATITGATGANTVNVNYVPATLTPGALTTTLGGTRSGDGAVSLALGSVGGWFVWATEHNLLTVTVSNYCFLQTTLAGTSSVYYSILAAVQTQIQALNLTGIANNVILKKLPTTEDFNIGATYTWPACLVTPGVGMRELMARDGSTNLSNDLGYPVSVALLDNDNRSPSANFNRDLLWRQKIIRQFEHKRLSGVSDVYLCRVEPDVILQPAAWMQNVWASLLTLRFFTRESRTP